MPGAVLTLQVGSFANYVGAHFWDLQDEGLGYEAKEGWQDVASVVDSEVLFSWTQDRFGNATYYPRAVLLDLSGSLGGVSYSRDAAGNSRSLAGASTWQGAVEVHETVSVPRSSFTQQLEAGEQLDPDEEDEGVLAAHQSALEAAAAGLDQEEGVRFWTDFIKAQLHPNTPLTLPGAWQGLGGDTQGFGDAASLMRGATREVVEAAADKLRWWAEACDELQGIQVLADDVGGFGSLSVRLLHELQDLLPNRPLLYFSLRPTPAAQEAGSRAKRLLSSALSMSEIHELVSLYIPLGFPLSAATHQPPYLSFNPHSLFHASALLAAGIDSITMPFRTSGALPTHLGSSSGTTDMHSLTQLLSGRNPNFAAAALQLPAGYVPDNSWQAAQQQDPRMQHRTAATAGGGGGGVGREPGSAAGREGDGGEQEVLQVGQRLLGLTAEVSLPGTSSSSSSSSSSREVNAGGMGGCFAGSLAESITLRGAAGPAGPCPTSQAASHLDQLLAAQHPRCVLHRCVVPMPLAIPLPFPALFTSHVSSSGGIVRAWEGGTQQQHGRGPVANGLPNGTEAAVANGHHVEGPGNPTPAGRPGSRGSPAQAATSSQAGRPRAPVGAVATCPVLSRLAASKGFQEVLMSAAGHLRRVGGSMAGRVNLEGWGYSQGDVAELEERLKGAAGRYSEEDSDDLDV